MKKFGLYTFTVLCTLFAFSHANAGDEFDGGVEDEFTVERFSDDEIRLKIEEKAKIACKGDRCELASVTNKGDSFKVVFSTGYGDENNNNSGSGSVIVVGDGGGNNNPGNEFFVGLQIQYITGECTQTVLVPESLYITMNTYLYRLLNEDGSVERQFSAAQQTMILFYTTILKQASGCTIPQ